MSKNNFQKEKKSIQIEEDSSNENDNQNLISPSFENIFRPTDILQEVLNNQSTTITLSSQNKNDSNHVDKKFLLQNEDIKDELEELSVVPCFQNEGSLENSFIQDLAENLEENDNFNEILEAKDENFVMLGRKRKPKSPDLDIYSSKEE